MSKFCWVNLKTRDWLIGLSGLRPYVFVQVLVLTRER